MSWPSDYSAASSRARYWQGELSRTGLEPDAMD